MQVQEDKPQARIPHVLEGSMSRIEARHGIASYSTSGTCIIAER
jgi:hypothetical protein